VLDPAEVSKFWCLEERELRVSFSLTLADGETEWTVLLPGELGVGLSFGIT
jgi:hypothetical protein